MLLNELVWGFGLWFCSPPPSSLKQYLKPQAKCNCKVSEIQIWIKTTPDLWPSFVPTGLRERWKFHLLLEI